jgi:hypothetical protein
MNILFRFRAGCVLLFLLAARASAADEPPVTHRIVCADYVGNKVAIIAADGRIEWEFPAVSPQDCWLLANGNVLFCENGGAKEVTPAKEIVWHYDVPAGAQCHSCQPLADGRVLLVECSLGLIVEVDRDGKVAKEIKVPSAAKVLPHQFRGTRKTADGHYWVCMMDEQKVLELAPDGSVLREIPMPGFPHEAIKLSDGHLLVTLGGAKRVVELDEQLKVVWEIGENELHGNPLRLPAACQRLPNGNTIIGNWLGGGFVGTQPQAFEVTRDKKVVWQFTDPRFKTVNQIEVLDTPTDPMHGGLFR